MKLFPENIYHIYNRGNNRQPIFFNRENYLFFLRKMRAHISELADILAYCLMPNHFHFMIYTPADFDELKFSNAFKILLSSYTRAINKQENFSGSLFQQNSKSKDLFESDVEDYSKICFHYIHQNPLKAKLVSKIEDWEFFSFRDYTGLRNGTLCNQIIAKEILDLPSDQKEFYKLSYEVIAESLIEKIF